MIKKILNPLLMLLLALSLFVAMWLFGAYKHWPLWVSLVTAAIVVLIAFSSRRSLLFIRKTAAQKKLRSAAILDKKSERLLSIQTVWKTAISTLRSSSRGKIGNPITMLPFFMVLGKGASGKTTLLANANVPIRFRNASPRKDPPPTDTIEFFFEDKAILLDTSGRYVDLEQNADINQEWELIVSLLMRSRRKESLSGAVITISVEDLWTLDSVRLSQISQNIRQRIDSLMRSTNTRFPVYVMVTKLDLLAGFKHFVTTLREPRTDEILGYLSKPEDQWSQTLEKALDSMVGRIRTILFSRADLGINSSDGLIFPLEVQSLEPLLSTFLRGLFEPSPYLELPSFRGLFLSSGTIRGSRFSSVLGDAGGERDEQEVEILDATSSIALQSEQKSLGKEESAAMEGHRERTVLTGSATPFAPPQTGVFLKEFFTDLLPADRSLYAPLGMLARWRRFSSNILLVSWYGVNLVAGLYFSYSFLVTYRTVRTLEDRQPSQVQLGGDFHQNLENLERYRSLVDWMSRKDRSLSFHLLAFSGQVIAIEDRMKGRFTDQFNKTILPELNASLRTKIRSLLNDDPHNHLADYAEILVRRINLIRDRTKGMGYDDLKLQPQPGTQDIVTIDPSISPQEARHFSDLYLAYIAWVPKELIGHNQDLLQSLLLEVEQTVPDFHWLVDWVDTRNLPTVTLATFWKGTVSPNADRTIPASYTNGGMRRIFDFLSEVQSASPPNFPIADHEKSFLAWYRIRKEAAWLRFVRDFAQGESTLADAIQWKGFFQSLPTSGNPYVLLANRLAVEFPPSEDSRHERWQDLLRKIIRIEKSQAQGGFVSRIKGYASILNESGTTGTHQGAAQGQKYFVSMIAASKAYTRFSTDLAGAVGEGLQGRGHALALTADFFSFNHRFQKKRPVLVDMSDALSTMRKELISHHDPKELIIWNLVMGQFGSTLDFLDREAACEINDRWIASVVSPAQASLTSKELGHFLFGSGGTIPAFMDKTMKPFVTRRANGYRLIRRNGYGIAISPEFLVFINTAIAGRRSLELAMKKSELESKKRHLDLVTLRESLQKEDQTDSKKILQMAKKQFPVVLKALPTDVNEHTLARPYLTRLTLECAQKTHVLNNFNLPVRSSWTWSPLVCGNTTLDIHIGNLTMTRRYPGQNGFAHFLEEFYQGTLRLTPQDFPLEKDALVNLHVSHINVRFHFTGAHALLSQYKQGQLALASQKRVREKIRKIDSELSILDQNDLDQQKTSLKDRPFATHKIPSRIANCFPGEPETSPQPLASPSRSL